MNCTPLDPVTKSALELQLADALKQYHLLVSGQAARVVVDQNGQRVEFSATTAPRLNSYILSLKQQLGIPLTACSGNVPSAPAMFYF